MTFTRVARRRPRLRRVAVAGVAMALGVAGATAAAPFAHPHERAIAEEDRAAIRPVAGEVELPDVGAIEDIVSRLLPTLSAPAAAGPSLPEPARPDSRWDAAAPPASRLPAVPPATAEEISVERAGDGLTVFARDAPVGVVLSLIAEQYDLNVVAADSVVGTVTVALRGVPLEDALDAILATANATWVRRHGILLVSRVEPGAAPSLQGRAVRVFGLDYVSALDVEPVVAGLLSPVGKAFVTEADPLDARRTRETLVVEDLPEYLARVAEYLAQVDHPPRQVLIEAYVLQVDLESSKDHGVDWDFIGDVAGLNLDVQTTGFSRGAGASPGLIVGLDTGSLDAIVTALQTTRDAKTLASPKVLVVEGNQARMQVGGRFGYLTETTTQTSTIQNVDFLEVGVVLRVTPRIAADGRIMLTLKPEVSNGQVDPATGLPEEETTEVESTVLLRDGQAMILGGLIQEEDSDRQQKVLGLGDLKYVGRLFGQRNREKDRTEIIIAVLPRLVPYQGEAATEERVGIDRVATPLFEGPLHPAYRPWEPKLPEATENPKELDFPRPKRRGWLRWPFGKGREPSRPHRHATPVVRESPPAGASIRPPATNAVPPPPGW